MLSAGRSREVYHTKRMQRIFCVCWSSDATYVMSGSDETNIRLWKAEASEKLGKLRPREVTARRYAAQLRHRYILYIILIYMFVYFIIIHDVMMM